MILNPLESVVKFAGRYLTAAASLAPARVRRALPSIITGVVLSAGARLSLTSMGAQVFSKRRHNSTMSRILRDRRFKTRELLWSAVESALAELGPKDVRRTERSWSGCLLWTAQPCSVERIP